MNRDNETHPHDGGRLRTGAAAAALPPPGTMGLEGGWVMAVIFSTNVSRVNVRVIRTNEELMIARSINRLLNLPNQTASH